tara:strand:+ start:13722 stop:13889 length:168 start_codon:yes stop_codon:yes gene_type:complete
MNNIVKLSDEVILEFIKIFQRGIIEFVDVTEDFRNLELLIDQENNIVLPIITSNE